MRELASTTIGRAALATMGLMIAVFALNLAIGPSTEDLPLGLALIWSALGRRPA